MARNTTYPCVHRRIRSLRMHRAIPVYKMPTKVAPAQARHNGSTSTALKRVIIFMILIATLLAMRGHLHSFRDETQRVGTIPQDVFSTNVEQHLQNDFRYECDDHDEPQKAQKSFKFFHFAVLRNQSGVDYVFDCNLGYFGSSDVAAIPQDEMNTTDDTTTDEPPNVQKTEFHKYTNKLLFEIPRKVTYYKALVDEGSRSRRYNTNMTVHKGATVLMLLLIWHYLYQFEFGAIYSNKIHPSTCTGSDRIGSLINLKNIHPCTRTGSDRIATTISSNNIHPCTTTGSDRCATKSNLFPVFSGTISPNDIHPRDTAWWKQSLTTPEDLCN